MRRLLTVGAAAAVLVLATGLAGPARAASNIDEEGTVGLSLFGDYGLVTGKSRYGLDFEGGGGYGVNLRYVVNPRWSLGLYFQHQDYSSKPEAERETNVKKAVMTQVIGDLYYYGKRNLDSSQYLVLGLGFYRPEIHYTEEEVGYPGENLVVSAGLGAEVYIRENWGLDLSVRSFGYFGSGLAEGDRTQGITSNGNFSVGLQAQAGILYYLVR